MGQDISTESRKAFYEFIDLLRQLDERYLGPEWGNANFVSDGHRCLMHMLTQGFDLMVECDPERPVFRRIASANRKFSGDNSDAIYFMAFIRPDRAYRIRGNTAGAVYTSFSFEVGTADGHYSQRVARAISDDELKIAPDGSYELILGPEPRPGNWFRLDPGVGSLQTRHYFEEEQCVAADPSKVIPLTIEALDAPGPRPAPTDASIAAALRRVITYVRGFTLDQPPLMQRGKVPNWVSTVPNQFNPAEKPGEMGLALVEAAYTMAPYYLQPDQALIMEGRFPQCRMANVCLWNHYLQTYDYETRTSSLNRKQTRLQPDGSFRIVVAHRDPGVPNWVDTAGQPYGMVYWRFLLPDEPVAPISTRVVALSEVTPN